MTTVAPAFFVPWCENVTRDAYNLTCFYLLFLIWIGNVSLATFGIYKVLTEKKSGVDTLFKTLYIIINILFAAAPSGYAFGIYSAWNCSFGPDFSGFQSWIGVQLISLNGNFYGLAFLYLFFLLRLHLTFNDSALELNKYLYYTLCFGFVVQLIVPIPSNYYFLHGWAENDRIWGLRFFNTFVYTNLICSSIVLCLFFKKIFLLTKQTRTRSHSMSAPKSSHNQSHHSKSKSNGHNKDKEPSKTKEDVANKMHDAQESHSLLFLSMRYMILALFAMMSTNLTSVYGFFRSEIPSIRDDPHVYNTHLVLNMLDCFINLICLYLQWSFGKKAFDKYCHCVDICFQNYCIKILGLDKELQIKFEPYNAKENTKTKTHSKSLQQSSGVDHSKEYSKQGIKTNVINSEIAGHDDIEIVVELEVP